MTGTSCTSDSMFEAHRLAMLGVWFFACYAMSGQTITANLAGMPGEVAEVMRLQEDAWNRGDLEGFMEGYWKSDSLMFIGKDGVTHGHAATLNRYQKGYPSQQTMGTLTFDNHHWESIAQDVGWLVGGWRLDKSEGEVVQGMYSLLWVKKAHGWVIVADHSS